MSRDRVSAGIERWEVWAVAAAVAAALLLALPRLASGFAFDELYTVHYFIRGHSFWEAISTYRVFNNHLGFTAAAHLSQALLGLSEWSVRLPALVLGLGTIPLTWIVGRRLISPQAGVLGAGLVALSPVALDLAVSARGYTGMTFFGLWSTLLFFRLLDSPRWPTRMLYAVVTAAAAYFHLWALAVPLVQGLVAGALAWRGDARARGFGMAWLLAGLLTVVSYAPVLEPFVHNLTGRGRGAHSPGFALDLLHYLGGGGAAGQAAAVVLLAALGWWRVRRTAPRPAAYFLLLLALPLAAALVVRPFDLYPRFFSYAGPYLLLSAAAGIEWLARSIHAAGPSPRRAAVAAIGLALVLLGGGRWALASWRAAERQPGYREAMAALEQGAGPGARLAVVGRNAEMMAFYATRPFATPETLDELQALRDPGKPLACAVLELAWNREGEDRIRDYLAQRSAGRRAGVMTLFFLDR